MAIKNDRKARKKKWMWIPAGFVLLLTTGCYRSPVINFYEPHVYKGSDDPLVSKLENQELQEQLDERFLSVQTDR